MLSDCREDDLLAIADAVASQPDGEAAIRFTACASAEFTTAESGFAHRALSYLLLEGLVEVLTTNWDDCIERGAPRERVAGVVNESDLLRMVGRSVLKIHGCATQPSTVLITSEHLAEPPTWVVDEIRARVGNSVIVFVGIGDIAGYVEKRLRDAVEAVGDADNVRVVSPSIVNTWEDSQWAAVLPGLPSDHRIPQTADEFLDDLASAHIIAGLQEIVATFSSEAEMSTRLELAVTAIGNHDCERVLRWLRRCAVVPKKGESVLRCHPLPTLLAAVGQLGGESFEIGSDGLVHAGETSYQVLAATTPVPWARVWREASIRLEALISLGCPPGAAPVFLVAGGQGTKPAAGPLPNDILGGGDQFDIVGGPANAVPKCLTADEVLAG